MTVYTIQQAACLIAAAASTTPSPEDAQQWRDTLYSALRDGQLTGLWPNMRPIEPNRPGALVAFTQAHISEDALNGWLADIGTPLRLEGIKPEDADLSMLDRPAQKRPPKTKEQREADAKFKKAHAPLTDEERAAAREWPPGHMRGAHIAERVREQQPPADDPLAGAGRRDRQVAAIVEAARALGLDPKHLSTTDKAPIRAECLKDSALFTESAFKTAWREANRGAIQVHDKHRYSRRS